MIAGNEQHPAEKIHQLRYISFRVRVWTSKGKDRGFSAAYLRQHTQDEAVDKRNQYSYCQTLDARMPPTVHLVRHGQAESNIDPAFRAVLDPRLTTEGVQQARNLLLAFPYHHKIKAVFSSPLQRALQTAMLAFGPSMNSGKEIIALPLAQETSHALCDTGRDELALKELFSESNIDYQYMVPGWNSKSGKWSQDDAVVQKRAIDLRDFLASRVEEEVVLVTHGFFLHFITEDWSESEKNGDCKSKAGAIITRTLFLAL